MLFKLNYKFNNCVCCRWSGVLISHKSLRFNLQSIDTIKTRPTIFLRTCMQVPPNVTTTMKAFNTAPSFLWWVSEENMDFALDTVAYAGLALSGFLVVWGAGNAIIFALLWVLYHSIVNVGQRWYICT